MYNYLREKEIINNNIINRNIIIIFIKIINGGLRNCYIVLKFYNFCFY